MGNQLGYDCTACWWPVTAEIYHATTEFISHGQVEAFRESPPDYEAEYVNRSRVRGPWSDDLRLGSALHELLLLPGTFGARWRVIGLLSGRGEPWNLRLKVDREERAALLAGSQGRWLTGDELVRVKDWRNALLEGKATGPFVRAAGAVYETPITWIDPETGLVCKCMPDVYIPATRTVVNVKTSRVIRPADFRREIENRGYHRGGAWYLDGEAALFGEGQAFHAWAVVDKETCQTALYTLRPSDLVRARAQNRSTLRAMAEAFKTGDWSAPFERAPIELDLSSFAFNEEGWELNGDSNQ